MRSKKGAQRITFPFCRCLVPAGAMFTLASGLYRYLTQRAECFVLILGLDNAGKTVCEQDEGREAMRLCV